MGRVLTVKLL